MFNIRAGIKVKILIVMLFLTAVTFGFAALLTLSNIKSLGDFTLENCNRLGENALNESKEALLKHSREELLSLVIGQTMIANVQLDRIEDEMAMMANLTGRYLLGEKNFIAGGNEQRFLSFKEPDPALKKSRIMVFSKDRGEEYQRNLSRVGRLHPLLKFIHSNQHTLDMVYICTSNGYYITYPWTVPREGFSPFKRQWYQEAVKADGREVWIGPYVSAHDSKAVLTCAKAIKNFKGEIIAVCAMDVTVKKITESFIDMKLIHSSRAFLIDKHANVLARRKMRTEGMQWYEDYRKENLLAAGGTLKELGEKMIAGEEGVCGLELPGEPDLYVAYAPVPATGWSLGVVVRSDALTAAVYKAESIMESNIRKHRVRIRDYFDKNLTVYLAIGLLVLLAVLILALVFSHRITAPVLMLKEKALGIMGGNFESGIHLNTGDELEALDRNFDKMTEEIANYIRHVGDSVREREKIDQELTVAGNIQNLMLPVGFREIPQIDIEAYLKPARGVSGDFYNYSMTDHKHLFFCIGKISGRGVPAAMLMARVMTLVSHLGGLKIRPEKLLHIANNALTINNKTDMSITVFCGCLNVESGKLVFSNAEHVPAVYINNGEISEPYLEKSISLGVSTVDEDVFKLHTLQLAPGDMLFFTTNGIYSEKNERGEVFGERYLLSIFKDFNASKGGVVEFALSGLEKFYGPGISKTDVAMLGIKYKGGAQ